MKLQWLALGVLGVTGLGCDSGGEKTGDVADAAVVDSAASDSAAETSAPADSGEATAAPDTSTPADTNAPADTTTPADTSVLADTGQPADTSVSVDVTDPERPKLTYEIGAFTVQSGQERQVCRTVNIPTDAPFDIVRFESEMRGISHHFNLYKVIDASALVPVSADETAVHDCSPAAEQLRGDAAYIYGSAAPNRVMQTPPGVAFHLEPGQRLIIEYHAINYTLDPIEASLEIDLLGAAPGEVIEHHADIIWFANWGFLLPPDTETSDTASCVVPYDVEVFGMMSHFHSLGTHFTVDAIRGGQSAPVYEDTDWQHPLYQPFDPPMPLAMGDQLEWTCTWNNTTGHMVGPNKGSKDEMCMVFAAAYPKNSLSADPVQCNVFF